MSRKTYKSQIERLERKVEELTSRVARFEKVVAVLVSIVMAQGGRTALARHEISATDDGLSNESIGKILHDIKYDALRLKEHGFKLDELLQAAIVEVERLVIHESSPPNSDAGEKKP